MLDCLHTNQEIIQKLSKHMYLTDSISDILVKFVWLCVPQGLESLEVVQLQVMTTLISLLEDNEDIVSKNLAFLFINLH